jgi:putative transposase
MPRKPRFNLIGVPQHVIQRGKKLEPCFYHSSDYYRYLSDLKTSAEKYDCRIHAHVLMSNHVHLLVTPMQDAGVSHMMQALGQRYVTYINKTYHQSGTLWDGRYKSSLVDSGQYLLNCMRYIELNPVRASLVERPGDYQWSSYHVNAQHLSSSFIEPHPGYNSLGNTKEDCQATYRELFNHALENDVLQDIREALNQELIYGRAEFKEKIEAITKRQVRPGKPGRPSIEEVAVSYRTGYLLC